LLFPRITLPLNRGGQLGRLFPKKSGPYHPVPTERATRPE
jgi:hypothetical protein